MSLLPPTHTLQFPFVALIRRELLRTMRTRYLSAAMMLVCGVGLVGVWSLWPGNEASLTEMAGLSLTIIVLFSLLTSSIVFLVLPGLAGGAIVEERNLDCYDLLRMTLIRPIGILAAKVVNSLGAFLLLVVAVLPIVSTTYFLVGVDWNALLVIALVIVTGAFTCTCIGLACSASFRNPLHAILSSYIWCAFALGGYVLCVYAVWVCAYFVLGEQSFDQSFPIVMIAAFRTTPMCIIARALGAPVAGSIGQFLSLQTGVSVLALFIAWNRLRKPPRESALPHATSPNGVMKRRRLPSGYSAKPRGPIPDWCNPVHVREMRCTGLLKGSSRWRIAFLRAILISIGLLLAYEIFFVAIIRPDSWELTSITASLALTFFGVAVGLAPAVAATGFVREDEQNTKDFLRMTLLSPREVVFGKFAASGTELVRLLFLLLLAGWPMLVIVGHSPEGWTLVLIALGWTLICLTSCFALSAVASMAVTRTVFAVPLAYGLCCAYFFGPSVAVLAIPELFHIRYAYSFCDELALMLSPVAYTLDYLDRMANDSTHVMDGGLALAVAHFAASLFLVFLTLRFSAKAWMQRSRRLHL